MSRIARTTRKRPHLVGKAATLVELRDAGFRIPEFLVSPEDVERAVHSLGLPLAVRSSATVEDGAEFSFAGQFDSYLNLKSLDEVLNATDACRASLGSESVANYSRRHGLSTETIGMEVILQRMVRAELSGVAFSIDPMTGREEIKIEACLGTAERLLAGETAPLENDHPMLVRYRPAIEALVRRLQLHFGAPQDVEFAIEQGEIFVLQSRPITRIQFESQIGEWTTALFRDGGVSSGVCSPLMWSLYEPVWSEGLKNYLKEIRLLKTDFQAARIFFGRPYWNLGAVKDCLQRLPGFVEKQFDSDLCVQPSAIGLGRTTRRSLANILRVLPSLVSIAQRLANQHRDGETLLRTGSEILQSRYAPPSTENPNQILANFRRLVEVDYRKIETTYFRIIFTTVLARLDFTTSFPDADYLQLMTALPEPRYIAAMRELNSAKARGASDLKPWVQRIAHHSPHGLDICLPRWDEEDGMFREMVQRSIDTPPQDSTPAHKQARAAAVSALKPWGRRAFATKLDRLRHLVWLREELRDLSNQAYYWLRRYALAVGEVRGIGEDVFLMTFQEILDDNRRNIDRNRDAYQEYRHFTAPHEIRHVQPQLPKPDACSMSGLGVSQGTATGRAWIATSLRQALSIEPGSILVCRFIEPCWVPLLERVAGIVAESGSALSHAAVMAREYNIPAVLGVPAATQKIQSGDWLRVRGGEGVVEWLR
jgi:phosphohistidine swiveling domain-containing protein